MVGRKALICLPAYLHDRVFRMIKGTDEEPMHINTVLGTYSIQSHLFPKTLCYIEIILPTSPKRIIPGPLVVH